MTSRFMSPRILIVDDDASIRASLSEALIEHGAQVEIADDGTAALGLLERFDPELALCDVRMADMGGLAFLDLIRSRRPSVDVILMTAFDDMETVASAMRAGAVEFLVKPIGLQQLLTAVDRVFDDRKLRRRPTRESMSTTRTNGSLVGRDPRMIEIYKLVGQAAATNATVLIRGESGTGKELVARAIHAHSSAANEPFVAVNCAALPNALLESELFGHVRGAFTGAHESRRGRFAIAGRGTIFLDEIGDTTVEFQTKLLRIVQDGEFQPVGSEKVERTHARVIAATHQPLEAMIVARRFREDLYYRLRVVEIVIPPLRDRLSDMPLLIEHLLARAADSLGVATPVLSPAALDCMLQHSWPGNVRELENCIKRAVVIASGSVIRPEHLSFTAPRADEGSRLSSLDDVEREQVVRVLAATGNHKGRAAEILGVSRPRLRRLIDKYGLQ
jgi:two-component system, NtrC family, response regulator HydG